MPPPNYGLQQTKPDTLARRHRVTELGSLAHLVGSSQWRDTDRPISWFRVCLPYELARPSLNGGCAAYSDEVDHPFRDVDHVNRRKRIAGDGA